MIRVTVPRQAAAVLVDGSLRLLVVEGEIEFEPWRHCTTDCEATGRCPVCERSYPPAGRSVPFEAHGSYCEPECDGWDDDRRRSQHLWPGELARLDRQAPAAIVQAIEAGERIEIDAACGMCGGDGRYWTGIGADGYDFCPHCDASGLVRVGSVRPVRVMPIVAYGEHCTVGRYIVFTGTRTFEVANSALPVLSSEVDLSLYGPAESLVGKIAVEVEDARREHGRVEFAVEGDVPCCGGDSPICPPCQAEDTRREP